MIFGSFSQDWKLVAPVSLLSGVLIFLYQPDVKGVIILIGTIIALTLTFALLQNKLRTYITFQPTVLLTPSIKSLTTFLILILSFTYYLSINQLISKNGFEIPDELIDQSIKLMQPNLNPNVQGAKYIAQVTPEQIEMLRQNPELLKQYGVDESMLNAVEEQIKSAPQQSTSGESPKTNSALPDKSSTTQVNPLDNSFVKSMLKSQFDQMLKPYQSFIAPALALLFFISLTSISSLLSIFINPLLLIIFYLLEKTNFVRFEKEMREVKKLVV